MWLITSNFLPSLPYHSLIESFSLSLVQINRDTMFSYIHLKYLIPIADEIIISQEINYSSIGIVKKISGNLLPIPEIL